MDERYEIALLDWLACAYGGRAEPAPKAARAAGRELSDRIVAAGAAGHVLDFDDTYLPGIAHLSAPVAPVACLLGAETGVSIADVLDAYAAGFEAMGALARASHPSLYDRGWHPTAVCGTVGAATAAALLLDADVERARALAMLSAGGLRAAFGSHGKSLQVGMAAAAGERAARLASSGAQVPPGVVEGFEAAYGATWARPEPDRPAIEANWIKAYPCCLQTHSSIEAADRARAAGVDSGPLTIAVHPVSRQAASYDGVADGLQAKFSIPYTVAFTLLHGPPGVADFARLDDRARQFAEQVSVRVETELLESEARLSTPDGFEARVEAAHGSPANPMTTGQLRAKVKDLAGDALAGVLDDRRESAKLLVETARLA